MSAKIRKKIRGILFSAIRNLATIISPTLNTKIVYYIAKGEPINLTEPKKFDEKISWLKLNTYNNNQLVSQCADKYAVREYVKATGNTKILNELYGVYNTVDDIPWDELPEKFVLKWNVGAGGNIICDNKEELDIESAKSKLKKFSGKKFYLPSSEMQYKKIEPKIVCEKYLQTETGFLPEDYKFYCFNGEVKIIMLCIGRETGNPKFYFFDRDWKLARINKDGREADKDFSIEKPDNLNEMFSYAESLSKPFPFTRVDLYNIEGEIVFGELTFTPGAGVDSNLSKETDLFLGKMLQLPI